MEYASFGGAGIKVSRLSLGTMTFGTGLDEAAARNVLDEAIDHGVTLVDAADIYGDSEAILGRLLGPRHQQIFLVTKVVRHCWPRRRQQPVQRSS